MIGYRVSRFAQAVPGEHGSLVLLHTRTGQLYLLNDPGAAMWRALTTRGSVEPAIVSLLRRHPMVPEETVRLDVQGLLAQLVHAEMIVPVQAPKPAPAAVLMALPGPGDRPLGWSLRVRAAAGLFAALLLTRSSFKTCVRWLRVLEAVSRRPGTHDEGLVTVAAVRRLSGFVPLRFACLEVSLATVFTAALAGRRLDWCVGASFDPLRFHAWVEAEGRVVVDPVDEPEDLSYKAIFRT